MVSTQRPCPRHVWYRCSGWSWHLLHMWVVPQQNQEAMWQQYLPQHNRQDGNT